ncbi:hypothetical protein V6N12_045925 [Hibiscus sabdariffa]|uniref:Uncharacterized protein n=1 Tax=Hibiscus sabdariffa TaxID=183260 RepID=A0ABR2G455_9ROSI
MSTNLIDQRRFTQAFVEVRSSSKSVPPPHPLSRRGRRQQQTDGVPLFFSSPPQLELTPIVPHFIPRTIPILLFHLAPPWLEPETRFVGVQKPHRPAKIYTSVCGGTQQLQVCAASSSSFTPW